MNTFKPDDTMLHNYLQNKLTPTEEEQLELWLADHPEVLEDLELDLVMKEGVKSKERKKLSNNRQHRTTGYDSSFSKLNYFVVGGLFAFSLMLFVFGVGQSDHGEGNFQILSLSPLRGGDSKEFSPIKTIKLNRESNQLILVVQLNFPDKGPFQIELKNHKSNKIHFKMDALIPQGLGDLNISVPTKSLAEGNFWLIVKHNERQIEKLPFSVQ